MLLDDWWSLLCVDGAWAFHCKDIVGYGSYTEPASAAEEGHYAKDRRVEYDPASQTMSAAPCHIPSLSTVSYRSKGPTIN